MLVKRLLLLPLVLIVAWMAMAVVVVRREAASQKETQLVLGEIGEPDSLNPILSQSTNAGEIEGFLFNALIGADEHQNHEPGVAEQYHMWQRSTGFFAAPDAAADALAALEAARDQWAEMKLRVARVEGSQLTLEFSDPQAELVGGTGYEERFFRLVPREAFRPVCVMTLPFDSSTTLASGQAATADAVTARLQQLAGSLEDVELYEAFPINDSLLSVTVVGDTAAFRQALPGALEGAGGEPIGEIMDHLDEALLNEPIMEFKLRRDVRWHDGEPVTAHDALFTYRAIVDPQYRSPRAGSYWLVKSAEAPDAYTFIVTYRKPFCDSISMWAAMALVPRHILEGRSGQWWADNYDSQPIGSGPFRFAEWKRNEYVRLEANPDYYEGAPTLPAVVYRVVPDSFVNEIAFQEDGFDLTQLMFHQVKRYEAEGERFKLFSRWGRGYLYIGWNLKNLLFADVKVRRALAHAVDTQRIIDYVYYGMARPCRGPIPDVYPFSNPDVELYGFDPDRARQMLAEAGWTDSDGDGWLDKDGRRFEFSLITNHGNPMRALIQALVQDDLKKVGIKVNTAVYEWAVFLKNYIHNQQFDACVLGWFSPRSYDRYALWHSSQAEPPGLNYCSYKNSELDAMLEEIRTTFEEDKLTRLNREVEAIIYRDQPYLFLLEGRASHALYRDRYVVRRPDEQGGWIVEPVRNTEAGYNGIDFYMPWWAPASEFPQMTP